MYAVIRIRGTANIDKDVEDTLHMLRLNKPNHCVVISEADTTKGMLQKVKDYVTWGEIDDKTLEELILKRGKITASKKINPKDVKKIMEIIKKGKTNEEELKPVFQLAPPKKGFESKGTKRTFKQGGALGYRKEDINNLITRMI